jgi:hypothetical protein
MSVGQANVSPGVEDAIARYFGVRAVPAFAEPLHGQGA